MTFDLAAAKVAAEEGMEQAYKAERVQAWKDSASAWFDALPSGFHFTADMLVSAVGLPDAGPARNNVVGAWFSSRSKTGLVTWTGRWSTSKRVVGHGNPQRIWEKT